jgi:ribosomal protein S18 acetylase RimI-like enzyme
MPASPPPAVVVEPLAAPAAAELDALAALLVAVVAEGASVGFLPPLPIARARGYWAGKPEPGAILLVARAGDGGVVGTVQVLPAESANGAHRAEIAKLLVHPGQRRRGIGRGLLAAAEGAARAAGKTLLVLDTREGDPATDLYRAAGWTEAGRIPNWARAADGRLAGTVFYFKDLSAAG